MLYLDANATETLRPAARAAAQAAMEALGNPASIHGAGRAARKILEDARETLAGLFHAGPADVIFCSGATEANALALHGLGRGRPVLIGATEHDSIRAAVPGATVLPVQPDGTLAPETLRAALGRQPGALLCLMAANNETGVMHDIEFAAKTCAECGALLHVDAVQAASRRREDWLAWGASSIAISGHKAGGIMGAGALILHHDIEIEAFIPGGGQEQGRRGGTPALPAVAAMAAALTEPYEGQKIASYRDEIEAFCASLGAVAPGAGARRLPNTLCLALPGARAETQLIALDMAGIAVSAGSACSSGKLAASHVLAAMGYGDLAGQAIRVSLPWNAAQDAVPQFTAAYAAMANRALRSAGHSA